MLKPFGDRVVAVEKKAAEKTASGIFLPAGEKIREKTLLAEIREIGQEVKKRPCWRRCDFSRICSS